MFVVGCSPYVLHHCHASTYGGHFRPHKTITKVLHVGFYWPSLFKDARRFVLSCDRFQRMGNISKRHLKVEFLRLSCLMMGGRLYGTFSSFTQ